MKARRKSVILFHIVFLLFTLSLSGCSTDTSKFKNSTPEEEPNVIQVDYVFLTLGDVVHDSSAIAYGTVLEKSEYTEIPEPVASILPPDEIATSWYSRRVTLKVEEGIKNCDAGDTITFWEPGGKIPDGRVIEHSGRQYVETGEKILAFLYEDGTICHIVPTEDGDGNVDVIGHFLVEETSIERGGSHKTPENQVMPMEEYLEIVENVVQEQKNRIFF
ncbi:MAG: hypothetical protein ACLU62_07745 [Hydrogeniiclostridium sp.]